MPRQVKDEFEAAVYVNRRLPAVEDRIKADIESALARRDFVRAHRYSLRLYLVEERFWTTAPCEVSS
jgi:hypothetical protein